MVRCDFKTKRSRQGLSAARTARAGRKAVMPPPPPTPRLNSRTVRTAEGSHLKKGGSDTAWSSRGLWEGRGSVLVSVASFWKDEEFETKRP